MKTNVILLAVMGAFLLSACKSSCSQYAQSQTIVKSDGDIQTKEIAIEPFSAIYIEGVPANVTYRHAKRTSFEITGSRNILSLLDIGVEGSTLIVSRIDKNRNISNKHRLDITVSSPSLNDVRMAGGGYILLSDNVWKEESISISIAGSGTVEANGVNCRRLRTEIAGSGEINFHGLKGNNIFASVAGSGGVNFEKVKGDYVSVSVAGSGNIALDGSAQEADYHVAGSGTVNAKQLEAAKVSAETAGDGHISCYATERLRTQSAGSGYVAYKGNPAEIYSPDSNLRRLR